jgi:HSP20 family protein
MVMSPWDWNGGRDPYRRLRSAVDRLFNEFAQDYPAWGGPAVMMWPAINVWEENDTFMLEAEVPGIPLNRLEISCQGRDLVLRGDRQDSDDPKERYERRERFSGAFVRSLTLPADIDSDRIGASLEDGVLRITIPKAETAKPRRIEVRSSRSKESPVSPESSRTGGPQ